MMALPAGRLVQWIYHLAAIFIFGTVFLRSLFLYPAKPDLSLAIRLLLFWLVLYVGETMNGQQAIGE